MSEVEEQSALANEQNAAPASLINGLIKKASEPNKTKTKP